MNEYDIEDAQRWFDEKEQPNLHEGARYLARLMGWTNSRSDGWQYWAKPKRAAVKLMALILGGRELNRGNYGGLIDITERQLVAALTPIKALITREGDSWDAVLNPPPMPDPLKELQRRAWEEGMAAAKLAAAGIKPAKNPYG